MTMTTTISVILIVSVAVAMAIVLAVMVSVIVPMLLVHFVAMKMLFPTNVPFPIGSFAPMRADAPKSEPWIVGLIHISVKAYGAVKPGTRANENSCDEPLRAVVAKRRAGIGRVVEVSVWTNWSYLDRGDRYRSAHANRDALQLPFARSSRLQIRQ